MSSGAGTYSAPSRNLAEPYADSRRRKSAVQIDWITLSTMTVKPNVTRSELNGLTLNLANTHCIATPTTKNNGDNISDLVFATSSELNGVTLRRANTHWSAAPAAKKHGAITSSVAKGSTPPVAVS